MNLIIDPEFSSLIPPLTDEEFAGLEKSIKAEGCRDALVVWNNDDKQILIDGHNRYKICQKHGIAFKTVEKGFESRNHAIVWMVNNQKSRRNLSTWQSSKLGIRLSEAMSAITLENRKRKPTPSTVEKSNVGEKNISDSPLLEQQKNGSADSFVPQLVGEQKPMKNSSKSHKREADSMAGKIVGVSAESIRKAKVIESKGTPEQIKALDSGEKTMNQVIREIKVAEMPEPPKPRNILSDAKMSHKKLEESSDEKVTSFQAKKDDNEQLKLVYGDIISKILNANQTLSKIFSDASFYKIKLSKAKEYLDDSDIEIAGNAVKDIQKHINRIKQEMNI